MMYFFQKFTVIFRIVCMILFFILSVYALADSNDHILDIEPYTFVDEIAEACPLVHRPCCQEDFDIIFSDISPLKKEGESESKGKRQIIQHVRNSYKIKSE